jgi:hypothetical protein
VWIMQPICEAVTRCSFWIPSLCVHQALELFKASGHAHCFLVHFLEPRAAARWSWRKRKAKILGKIVAGLVMWI